MHTIIIQKDLCKHKFK